MVAHNHSWHRLCAPLEPPRDRLAQQIETYLVAHPELSREGFLLSALHRELVVRSWTENKNNYTASGIRRSESDKPTASRPSLSDSDTRFHAVLAARVVALHRPKQGRWPSIPRVLLLNPFRSFV